MSSKELTPLEFEKEYLKRQEGDSPRKNISIVLSGEQIDRIWSPDKGLTRRVRAFYEMAFRDAFRGIPRDVPESEPEDIRLLSALRRFKEDRVAWRDVSAGSKNIDKDKHLIIILPLKALESEQAPQNVFYVIHKFQQGGSSISILPIAATQRFASISLAGGLASIAGQELQKGVREEDLPRNAQIALAEQMTNHQYLKKAIEILDTEGITDQSYGRVSQEQFLKMHNSLDSFLFPNMQPLSDLEAGYRALLSSTALTYQ